MPGAWSLTERPGWLRLHGLSLSIGARSAVPAKTNPAPTEPRLSTAGEDNDAASPELARDTLTQKLWGEAGTVDVKLDAAALTDGQRAGLAFMCGKNFSAVGVVRAGGVTRVYWDNGAAAAGKVESGPGSTTPAAVVQARTIWLRGSYHGKAAHLSYSVDGTTYVDTGLDVTLTFSQWKGARLALFCYGEGGGAADFDYFRFQPGNAAVPVALPNATPIDREALVTRHNPVIRKVDYTAPLTVGNGKFAFTVDVTGLQTFEDAYYKNGIPLETLARWCWITDDNPQGYSLADTSETYRRADGGTVAIPSQLGTPAAEWLRRNPRLYPLGQLALEWDKPDGSTFTPADIEDPEQTLDLWRGIITSRYQLGGVPVTVTTSCDPQTDTVAVRLESELVSAGKLRVRLAFPRDHDTSIKNTPPLDWSHPESHESKLVNETTIARRAGNLTYSVTFSARQSRAGLRSAPGGAPGATMESGSETRPTATAAAVAGKTAHTFTFAGSGASSELDLALRFSPDAVTEAKSAAAIESASAAHWATFWRSGAAVDFTGSTNPLAPKLENRIILSRYLTATQSVGDVPPQESGLTCNTWYGKHHTEMIWWHIAHFILWGETAMAERNLGWFRAHLPEARALAASRGLHGARWAKMVGPDDRESPGGNPLIVWNQPHPIYLADLILRQSPSVENLAKYRDLVQETAECLASMLVFDKERGEYVLGPPLWIAQEIYDPATSQDPCYELAYWRWALATAQRWRLREGLDREASWDEIIAHLPPLPQKDGKYVALESHPDTWDNLASRHDHPEMLMALGFLPETPSVDRATMNRTLDAVFSDWDWKTKIWGWDYPMVAMTATRLGRPADAVEVLLRDGPNNRYTADGHCPQGSDRAQASQTEGRREIAVYLPANGSFLSAVALMVAGWQGCDEPFPGFPKDGTWTIRAESLTRLP